MSAMPAKRATKRKTFKTSPEKVRVAQSGVHGRGVYATAPIRKSERIIEYTGEHLPWKEAMELPPRDASDPYHTFFFSLDNGDVIDAAKGGNDSRWINHSCDPNCETTEEENRIFVFAKRAIRPGEELFYDYKIVPAERRTKKLEKEFACCCGSADCRGTMLEPKAPKATSGKS
ncbi:MAG: SET domain-containing protein-lysine N-methyltransferase [Verrucomicrobiota bacterium]|nr:SET domain-containing protein-lysine N-methyltransferase [Verrucomicrobiota bacterium]